MSDINTLYQNIKTNIFFNSKDNKVGVIYPFANLVETPIINNNLVNGQIKDLLIYSFIPNSCEYIDKCLKFSFSKGTHKTFIIVNINGNYKQPSVYSNINFEIFTKLRCNDLIFYENSYKCSNLSSIVNNNYNFNITFNGIEKEIIIDDNMSDIYVDFYININSTGELYKIVNINSFEYIIKDKVF
jgi:hypothetical protein